MTAPTLIDAERATAAHKANAATFDATNTVNDSIAIAAAYLGRAAQRMPRNERDGCSSQEMLVKAAAVLQAALGEMA